MTETAMPTKRRGRPRAHSTALAADHDKTRQLICGAAFDLYQAGGLPAVSIRDVAKRLGVSPMMPYRYFPSKDHIMQEMRVVAFRQFTASLRRARLKAKRPEDSLAYVCSAYLIFAASKPHLYRLMFDLWVFDNVSRAKQEFGEGVHWQPESWREIEASIISYLRLEHSTEETSVLTNLVWISLHGAATLHQARKLVFFQNLKKLSRPLINMLLAEVAKHRIK
ncbi:TetR/AcrR family transcriptional regulator [Gimibacter soli]|uniref:TetR/AcrR family transcriptional regulator n=1 Tax=Gimibacter soli TaxID=3024400 RepID=A0AAE9XUH5_9PROT|nr:TetR/AcrR family transcriptional regulator [Gimibacter soli]WCL55600.1 TetR/AcrR family transcriptional regulator [Gimibacter soli]